MEARAILLTESADVHRVFMENIVTRVARLDFTEIVFLCVNVIMERNVIP